MAGFHGFHFKMAADFKAEWIQSNLGRGSGGIWMDLDGSGDGEMADHFGIRRI